MRTHTSSTPTARRPLSPALTLPLTPTLNLALVLGVLLLGVLVCGTLGGCGGRRDAGTPVALTFEGRDLKQVLAAFPAEDRDVLEHPDHMTLLALYPSPIVDGKLSPQKERLHKWGILGQAEIKDAAEQHKLIEAVYRGLKAEGAGPASCFNPRHALSLEKGARRIDLVICFECTWIYIYGGSSSGKTNRLLFSPSVSPVFDALFKKHGLKKSQD